MELIYKAEQILASIRKRFGNWALLGNAKDMLLEFVGALKEGSGINEYVQFYIP